MERGYFNITMPLPWKELKDSKRAVIVLDGSAVLRPRTLHNYVCNNISWAPRGLHKGVRSL